MQSWITGLDLKSSDQNRKIFPEFFLTDVSSSFITFMKKDRILLILTQYILSL